MYILIARFVGDMGLVLDDVTFFRSSVVLVFSGSHVKGVLVKVLSF